MAVAGSLQQQAEATHQGACNSSNATSVAYGGGQRHRSRVRQHHRQHQMTETPYCGMYVDDIWLATSINNREFDVRWMSTQLDQLIQSGNLQPAPLALYDLGGVPGQYHLRWSPHFVDLRASTSMMHSAPEGYSYLGVTPDNTPLWWSEVETERCHAASAALGPH